MENFIYDKETHTGYYKGKAVPSITQLLAIEYSMSGIPQDRLDKASEYGTNVHDDIENFNKGLSDEPGTREGKNYKLLCEKFNLSCVSSEKQVFITDDNGEVIAYGTFDAILVANDDSIFANIGDKILTDFKTVSQFDNEKVEKQLNMYALGYKGNVDKICGIWLREDTMQIRPLELKDYKETYEYVLSLRKEWDRQNGIHE